MEIDGLKLEMAKMQKQKDALTEDLELVVDMMCVVVIHD